jgi:hypothetical protein
MKLQDEESDLLMVERLAVMEEVDQEVVETEIDVVDLKMLQKNSKKNY